MGAVIGWEGGFRGCALETLVSFHIVSGVALMQLADLVIDQSEEAVRQLVNTYESVLGLDGMFVTAVSQFERDCLALSEEGWQLKRVSHRGSIVFPAAVVVATYEK
jgi:hypothetical protein